jgi:hypothetical protein
LGGRHARFIASFAGIAEGSDDEPEAKVPLEGQRSAELGVRSRTLARYRSRSAFWSSFSEVPLAGAPS